MQIHMMSYKYRRKTCPEKKPFKVDYVNDTRAAFILNGLYFRDVPYS